jgi:hypothetical protein
MFVILATGVALRVQLVDGGFKVVLSRLTILVVVCVVRLTIPFPPGWSLLSKAAFAGLTVWFSLVSPLMINLVFSGSNHRVSLVLFWRHYTPQGSVGRRGIQGRFVRADHFGYFLCGQAYHSVSARLVFAFESRLRWVNRSVLAGFTIDDQSHLLW